VKILREHMLKEYGVDLGEDSTPDDFVSAYIKQKGARVAITYPQQMHFINITINNYCNLNCYSCDQFVDSAPAKRSEQMTLQQIKDFVEESQNLQWRWDEIRVTGGEPSLHSDFFEILTILNQGLKQKYLPNMTLKIISNGTGKRVRKVLDIVNADIFKVNDVTDGFYLKHVGHPDWIVVCSKPLKDTVERKMIKNHEGVEEETQLIPEFGNVWQAPVDRLEEISKMYAGDRGDISVPPIDGYYAPSLSQKQQRFIEENQIIKDCQVHASCGFELSPQGISPCGCGGGRAIGNEEIYFDSLSDVTLKGCEERLAKMCAPCGQNMSYIVSCSKRLEKSEFWRLILANYRLDKPKMKRYNPFSRTHAVTDENR